MEESKEKHMVLTCQFLIVPIWTFSIFKRLIEPAFQRKFVRLENDIQVPDKEAIIKIKVNK
jgi:hypothetical protein